MECTALGAVRSSLQRFAAIDRVRIDALRPGQRLATAMMEVCDRVMSRDNEITILWVPARRTVARNELADA